MPRGQMGLREVRKQPLEVPRDGDEAYIPPYGGAEPRDLVSPISSQNLPKAGAPRMSPSFSRCAISPAQLPGEPRASVNSFSLK